jgi:hypothetical protein
VPLKKVGEIELPSTDTPGNPIARLAQDRDRRRRRARRRQGRAAHLLDAYEWDVTDGDVLAALKNKPRKTPCRTSRSARRSPTARTANLLHGVGHERATTRHRELHPAVHAGHQGRRSEDRGCGSDSAADGASWYSDLSLTDITYLIGGIGVLGLLLVGAGVIGIVQARKKRVRRQARTGGASQGRRGLRRRSAARGSPAAGWSAGWSACRSWWSSWCSACGTWWSSWCSACRDRWGSSCPCSACGTWSAVLVVRLPDLVAVPVFRLPVPVVGSLLVRFRPVAVLVSPVVVRRSLADVRARVVSLLVVPVRVVSPPVVPVRVVSPPVARGRAGRPLAVPALPASPALLGSLLVPALLGSLLVLVRVVRVVSPRRVPFSRPRVRRRAVSPAVDVRARVVVAVSTGPRLRPHPRLLRRPAGHRVGDRSARPDSSGRAADSRVGGRREASARAARTADARPTA